MIEDASKAVDMAVSSCIKDDILKEFLIAHRAEVLDVCITEFDEKTFVDGIKEEGREEGIKEGREEGIRIRDREKISQMLQKGKSPEEIAEFCDYPMELVMEVQNSLFK